MKNVYLLLASLFLFFCLLLMGEVACRLFLNINYVGISSNLLVPNAYGPSMGNAKNVEAVAFGAKVYTDNNGFRVDPENADKETYDKAIALIGDSVAFGVGVKEGKTIAGLLRRKYPDIKIYNTSVSGYRVNDYRNILTEFVLKEAKINKVFLLFCLNDVSYTPVLASDEVQVDDARLKGTSPLFNILAKINNYLKINEHLRQRSHLYHVAKNILADPSMGYFLYDLQYYSSENPQLIKDMEIMAEIGNMLKKADIEFKVLILPYKVQLKSKNPSFLAPQKMLSEYFEKSGLDYFDLLGEFARGCKQPSKCYLYGDPLHLSEKGHEIVANALSDML